MEATDAREPDSLRCIPCTKTLVGVHSFVSHLVAEHPNTSVHFNCVDCRCQFNSYKSDWIQHLSEVHGCGSSPLPCANELCHKSFNKLSSLIRHYKKLHGSQICCICGCKKSFNCLADLNAHQKQTENSKKRKRQAEANEPGSSPPCQSPVSINTLYNDHEISYEQPAHPSIEQSQPTLLDYKGSDQHTRCNCGQSRTQHLQGAKYEVGRTLLADTLGSIMLALPTYQNTGELRDWVAGIEMLKEVFDLDTTHVAIAEKPQGLWEASASLHPGWISTTTKDLESFIEDGELLPDHILAIRLEDSHGDCGRVESAFLQWLENDVRLPYQNWHRPNKNSPFTKYMSKTKFLERYDRRRAGDARLDTGDFRNFLSISGSALEAEVPEPPFIQKLGYNLLHVLKKQIWNRVQAGLGSRGQKEASMRVSDCEACFRFVLYGERYSFSDWHIDVLTGTWVTFVTGWKAWFIYVGPWNKSVEEDYLAGVFRPTAEDVQVILLGPGDSLFMRPGLSYPVAHCVLTLDDSIGAGGMSWSAGNIEKTMKNLDFVIRNRSSTNEHIPRQLPEYLDALLHFVDRNKLPRLSREMLQRLDRPIFSATQKKIVREFVGAWKKEGLLSCECDVSCTQAMQRSDKETACPCLDLEGSVHAGCTKWCMCKC